MSLDLVVLIFSTVVGFLVGSLVFFKNPNQLTSRIYGVLSLCLILYPVFNHFSLQTDDRLLLIRLVMAFSSLSVALQYALVTLIINDLQKLTPKLKHILYISVFVALLNMTAFVFSGLTEGPNPLPIPAPGVLVFILHFISLTSLAVIKLFKSYRKSYGLKKNQIYTLNLGMMPIVAISPFTSFVMPVLFKNSSLVFLSPVYGAFFVSMVGYAIFKHRLFDVRLIVVRSLAYLLSLGLLSLIYGGAITVIGSLFNDALENNQLLSTLLTISSLSIAAVSYSPLKTQFDKLTSRLFYRDAYDPQVLLDDLNKELVSNIDLESLLSKCAKIIQESLKSDFVLFGLKETAYSPRRIIGEGTKDFNESDVEFVRGITPHTKQQIIVSDELDESNELKPVMRKYNIAILARLATDLELEIEGLGYLILGQKKSGNPYNKQDMKMLEIIANELVIAVQNALRFEEIEKFNITLQDKVDAATAELQRTNEKLKEMDETKDEFISMASHQLRTPLTSVKGYLSMVLEGDVGKVNKQQNKMLEQAFLSSQRMVYLIADLLNVSRLKTGKFIIDAKETNLADVVAAEVEQLMPTAKARDLKLTFKKPKNFPIFTMDETKTRQVIMNFIDNAIYYTPAKGKIEVSLEDKGDIIEYKVKDNGIGVPKTERHNLFSKFYRAANAKSARPDGTGLGLFMAKKVVVAQGGAIIFESEEGKGSTFGFSFAKEKLEELKNHVQEQAKT